MTKHFQFRTDAEVRDALNAAAKRNGISANALLDRLVRVALNVPFRDKATAVARELQEASR